MESREAPFVVLFVEQWDLRSGPEQGSVELNASARPLTAHAFIKKVPHLQALRPMANSTDTRSPSMSQVEEKEAKQILIKNRGSRVR